MGRVQSCFSCSYIHFWWIVHITSFETFSLLLNENIRRIVIRGLIMSDQLAHTPPPDPRQYSCNLRSVSAGRTGHLWLEDCTDALHWVLVGHRKFCLWNHHDALISLDLFQNRLWIEAFSTCIRICTSGVILLGPQSWMLMEGLYSGQSPSSVHQHFFKLLFNLKVACKNRYKRLPGPIGNEFLAICVRFALR